MVSYYYMHFRGTNAMVQHGVSPITRFFCSFKWRFKLYCYTSVDSSVHQCIHVIFLFHFNRLEITGKCGTPHHVSNICCMTLETYLDSHTGSSVFSALDSQSGGRGFDPNCPSLGHGEGPVSI